jgi:hypothetical protein
MIKEINMATNLDTADFFQSRFFKAENDLGEEGAELTVTIKTVDGEKVGREKELRPVLHFTGDTKPLILNKTNWSTLRNAFGPAKNWEGQQIVLFAKLVEFGGETTLGTRVRVPKKEPPQKAQKKPAVDTADDLNDEIPF